MNTILQKRIEEAKQKEYPLPPMVDGAVCKVLAMAEQTAYKKGATFALENQWISVEEALPDKGHDVLVAVLNTKTNTYFYGFDAIVDDSVFLRDKNGFSIEVDYHKITHWMPIPQLEGGEK